jgi:hypothetical protein
VPPEPGVPQIALQVPQVLLHQRLQRGVDRGRGSASVLTDDRVQLVRQREGKTGPPLGEKLADAELMPGVDRRPEQADGDRLGPEPARLGDRLLDACLVERAEDVAFRVDSLPDLEREKAGDVRRTVRNLTEGLELAALAQEQDVGKAFGGEEGGAGRLSLHDRVRRPRRAVGQHVGPGEQLRDGETELGSYLLEPLPDRVVRTLPGGRRLADPERSRLVRDDDVGEGAARVDRDPVAHHRSNSSRWSEKSARLRPMCMRTSASPAETLPVASASTIRRCSWW